MQRLRTFLDSHCDNADVAAIIDGLMVACKDIAYQLHLGDLGGVLGSAEQENVQGECQKKLDVISNDVIKDCLA
ncbi:MAG: fructose-bisphosphatase class I, partial [Oleibacter sp.]|nr:fructose-bisphosphatase class I [Thalassolituus sp.]